MGTSVQLDLRRKSDGAAYTVNLLRRRVSVVIVWVCLCLGVSYILVEGFSHNNSQISAFSSVREHLTVYPCSEIFVYAVWLVLEVLA